MPQRQRQTARGSSGRGPEYYTRLKEKLPTMRSISLVVVGALSLFALSGCNSGQPRMYRVAIDNTNERNVGTPTCYIGNQVPSTPPNAYSNYYTEGQWTIWGGTKTSEYLDLAHANWKLADSHQIDTYGIIEGENKKFSGNRTWFEFQQGINMQGNQDVMYTYAYSTTVTVTFNDYSFSPEGTIDLAATYQCQRGFTDCPGQGVNAATPPPATSCAAQLSFVGRLIDADNITAYNNDPASGEPQ